MRPLTFHDKARLDLPMQLREAIHQVSAIRSHLAAAEHLKSLRAVPVVLSGLLAVVAATVQATWVRVPADRPQDYLLIWCSAALLGSVVAAAMVARRVLRAGDQLGAANALLALRQFAPTLIVGATVTWFVYDKQPALLWLLPGIWQMLFGLGSLATHRLFPAPAFAVGVMFLVTGACCLWLGERALAPWAMGVPFAAGQGGLAVILWWHHERRQAPAATESIR
ncbi:MAG: hypothetical protein VYD05_02395 [Planctomycetota bacterium]|nr:hypothetical protein [Planctomycetota bacterium]